MRLLSLTSTLAPIATALHANLGLVTNPSFELRRGPIVASRFLLGELPC
jgi:hypothetical protein